MSGLGRVVRGGVGRHRVQTVVTTLTVLMAVTASVLAAGLIVASQAPFDHAFARQHGAHLAAQFDGAKATTAQLAGTEHASGVTAAAGPFPTIPLQVRTTEVSGPVPAGADLPQLTVVGRATASGSVDDVTLEKGRWPRGPGEIVLAADGPLPADLGVGLEVPSLPGKPTLTVVGIARSVTDTADAWVTPAGLQALTPAGTVPDQQMLYRFSSAGTKAEVAADRAAIEAAAPPGALTGTQSYLSVKQDRNANTAAYVPFVMAFGILGLVMSTLIVGVVVSGSVGAATRRIGVLKSVGLTPAQVVRAYMGQALVPAVVGVALGVVLANLLAVPILHEESTVYSTGTASIPPWIDITVSAAALALVAGTALVPALRAGRLRTVEAITVGRTPPAGRGRRVRRLTGRLPLPRPLSLGLANPFTRLGRSTTIAAAVLFGAVTATFAVGLALSLNAFQSGRDPDAGGAVVVDAGGGPGAAGPGVVGPKPGAQPSQPADPAEVAAAIREQRGTRRFYGTARAQLSVSGITGGTTVVAYDGDSSWSTHQMISGHWLTGAGQAVVNTRFLDAAGLQVGDTITLTSHQHSTRLQIVGEVLDTHDDGMDVRTELSSLAGLGSHLKADSFNVDVQPGTDVRQYLTALNTKLQSTGAAAFVNPGGRSSDVIATMDALVATLTLMLVAVAGLGVLNTVVLDTRERVHDLGVFKALGMTPRQTIAMVITSVAGIGLVAGVVGVPIGVALHHYVIPLMGHAAGTGLPQADIAVYHLPQLAALALGGLVIAVAGALLPAGWAARTPAETSLRTE